MEEELFNAKAMLAKVGKESKKTVQTKESSSVSSSTTSPKGVLPKVAKTSSSIGTDDSDFDISLKVRRRIIHFLVKIL
jgi:hypothetical protein